MGTSHASTGGAPATVGAPSAASAPHGAHLLDLDLSTIVCPVLLPLVCPVPLPLVCPDSVLVTTGIRVIRHRVITDLFFDEH